MAGVDARGVHGGLPDYPGNSAHTALTGWQTLCPEYVIDFPCVCICVCARLCVCSATESSPCKKGKVPIIILKPSPPMTFLRLRCVRLHSIKKGQRRTWLPCTIRLRSLMHILYFIFFCISLFSLNAARVLPLNDFNVSAAPTGGTFSQVAAVDLPLARAEVTQMVTKVVG